MPKKYRPQKYDYFFFSAAVSVYGMLRPIEEQLQKGGYQGNVLSDYSDALCNELEREPNSTLFYNELMENSHASDDRDMLLDSKFMAVETLTKSSAKDFRNYTKKYSDYLELLIKNTPPEEYPEELSELKYHQAYLRMLSVFGARELWHDQLGFLMNARAYDGDMPSIKETGNKQDKGISRELWRHIRKYYPYSELRDSIVELTNLVCDREESKEKDTYTEQIEFREKYKKALQNFLAANEALGMEPKDFVRRDVIKEMKQQDGPEKDVDYYGILQRVEEQDKNGEEPDPREKAIAEDIKTRVDNKFNAEKNDYKWSRSRFEKELQAAGCVGLNEIDFTGNRGNKEMFFSQVEAQINAIDMGWPVDELVHIQRLQMLFRKESDISGKPDTPEHQQFKEDCIAFYNDRIKDKKYPATEEARQAFYRDFYDLARRAENVIWTETLTENDYLVYVKWDIFRKEMKKTMDKPLSPTQKTVLQHVQDENITVLSTERMNAIREQINTRKRFGHIDSSEFSGFKRAFTQFAEAFQADANAFKINKEQGLSPENLELLKKVREAARVYLKERDNDETNLDDRSAMGKARYEGAAKTFTLVHDLILKHEKRLEDQAKMKKEAECAWGRKETREAFFKAGSPEEAKYIKFAKKRAGGEEAYQAQLAEEKRREEEEVAKEPVTDDEKYEKLINGCRLNKDAPVETEAAEQSSKIENLSLMIAAQELQKAGSPFDMNAITNRGKMIRTVYHMDDAFRMVSQDPKGWNGPKMLKNALTFPFRADEVKRSMEEPLYDVRKSKYRNTFEAQNKYQADLAEVLSRKRTEPLTDEMKDLVEAVNEVMRINLKDNTLVGLNAYKLRKANVKIMKAVVNVFDKYNSFEKDGFAPKMALDTLAVLTTYTGCEPVTRKFLNKLNATKKTPKGQDININIDNFTRNYGVKHSKNVTAQVRNNANQAHKEMFYIK